MKKADPKFYKETTYGFLWGAVEVCRLFTLPSGAVALMLKTNREEKQVVITPTGLIRIYDKEGGRLTAPSLRKEEK